MATPPVKPRTPEAEIHRGPRVSPWEDQPVRESGQPSWMVAYLDLLTILLALFVLIVAYAEFKPLPYDQMSRSVASELSGPVDESFGQDDRSASVAAENPQAARLKEALKNHQLDERVGISLEKNRVNLEIKDDILFRSASADLTGEGLALLDGLVPILQETDFPVSVEGHTDDRPIRTARFPSNWELSAGRASTVVRHLIGQGLVDGRLKAVGHAATVPVADNLTDEGRARNRRVVLVIHMAEEGE